MVHCTPERRQGMHHAHLGGGGESIGGDYVIPGAQQVEQHGGNRGHAKGAAQCGLRPLQLRYPRLEHRTGWARVTSIDLAPLLVGKAHCPLLSAVEDEGGGLVDGRRHRAGGTIGMVAGVKGAGTLTFAVGHRGSRISYR